MRRRLFTLCSAGSLLLCAAVCGLWVRSYWRADVYLWQRDGAGAAGVRSNRGALGYVRARSIDPARYPFPAAFAPGGYQSGRSYAGPPGLAPVWRFAGFGHAGATLYTVRMDEWTAPHWSLALLTALLPAAWAARQARRRIRRGSGLCPACGYDLRATPDRCPECGAPAAAASSSAAAAAGPR